MDKLIVPASITLEKGFSTQKYRWKSNSKRQSIYKRPCKRAFIRFSCKNLSHKLSRLSRDKRQICLEFIDQAYIRLRRTKTKGISLQGCSGLHPYVQFIVNSVLPKNLKEVFKNMKGNSKTFPLDIEMNLSDWEDINISPEDFLIEVEKDAKTLMKKALQEHFLIGKISKGRICDLHLIRPDGVEFVIAISYHVAKTESRSKEKRIQKILMDISKMLVYIWGNKRAIPVIISQPLESKNSWSYTTKNYLDFYKEKFGFIFLTTDFKKGWENDIVRRLLEI